MPDRGNDPQINQFNDFLQEHDVCEQFVCSTCGIFQGNYKSKNIRFCVCPKQVYRRFFSSSGNRFPTLQPNKQSLWDFQSFYYEGIIPRKYSGNWKCFVCDKRRSALTNCTFLNNFASFQGGQIVSSARGSVDLYVAHSVFKQTIQVVITNTQEFMATSFLRLYNSGTLFVYNTSFNSDTNSDEPLILVLKAYRVSFDNASMSNCPVGHAIKKINYDYIGSNYRNVISLTLSCKACDYNFYSLQRGTARGLNVDDSFECTPCPRGADCVPAVRSKSSFWGYQTSSNPPKLAFTICPFGYCKSPPANSSKYNHCQGKRTGVMCAWGVFSRLYRSAVVNVL